MMDHKQFPARLSQVGQLSAAPRRETEELLSGGDRVRNAFHVQAAISRHGQLTGFLRRCRRVAAKHLDNCLRWFRQVELDNASHIPRQLNRRGMHTIWRMSRSLRREEPFATKAIGCMGLLA